MAANESGAVGFYVSVRVPPQLALRMKLAADTEPAKAVLVHSWVNTAAESLQP